MILIYIYLCLCEDRATTRFLIEIKLKVSQMFDQGVFLSYVVGFAIVIFRRR